VDILKFEEFYDIHSFKDFTSFFDVRLPEDNLKEIETFRSISGLYESAYFIACAFVSIIY